MQTIIKKKNKLQISFTLTNAGEHDQTRMFRVRVPVYTCSWLTLNFLDRKGLHRTENDALPALCQVYVYFFVTRKETLENLLRLYFVTFLVVTNCFLLTVYIELIFYENKWWQQTMLHRGKWKWLPRPSSLFSQKVLSHWMSHPVHLLLLRKNKFCMFIKLYIS